MAKVVPPQLGLESFSCPHCGALAAQSWFRMYYRPYGKDDSPRAYIYDAERAKVALERFKGDTEEREYFERLLKRSEKNLIFYDKSQYYNSDWYLANLNVGLCFACSGYSVWVADALVHPNSDTSIAPHEDMPPLIAADFKEAASIVDQSARGAAALLRLCVQKLVGHLGADATNLNVGIGELVQKGLDPQVQKALDIVRVIGNNAVHPGQIDLDDNKGTAVQLFSLVNIIVMSTITTQKQIEALYGSLPPGALEAIEKRDKE